MLTLQSLFLKQVICTIPYPDFVADFQKKGGIMKHVRHILEKKGKTIHYVSPDDTVFSALAMMAEKSVSALLVKVGNELVGIISEKDYARKVVLLGRSSKEELVKEIMTTEVVYVDPGQSIEECMALMSDKHIRHLPVYDDDKLVGIISIGDVVKAIIEEKQFMIQQLEHYIHGHR